MNADRLTLFELLKAVVQRGGALTAEDRECLDRARAASMPGICAPLNSEASTEVTP
jgi:hypothetical protein